MSIFKKYISLKTNGLNHFTNITEKVQSVVKESKIKSGMVFLNNMHTTCAIIIQEDDPKMHRDLTKSLERILPMKEIYEHNHEGPINATAHIKSALFLPSQTIALENNKIILGRWQQIFLVEFGKQTTREILVTIMGDI